MLFAAKGGIEVFGYNERLIFVDPWFLLLIFECS